MNVPHYGIFLHLLPPTDSIIFKNYLKINSFSLYRRCFQEALTNAGTVKISYMARDSWKEAQKEFKEFFANYAREVLRTRREKVQVYKIRPYDYKKKSCKHKRSKKSNESVRNDLFISQEHSIGATFEEELKDFEFVNKIDHNN